MAELFTLLELLTYSSNLGAPIWVKGLRFISVNTALRVRYRRDLG